MSDKNIASSYDYSPQSLNLLMKNINKDSLLIKESKALIILVFFHLLIITSSNYLVQIPIDFRGVTTTWGAFTFPFIFLATDLTVRIFGAPLARKIIFFSMLPALIISYLVSVLFQNTSFQGFAALGQLNIFVLRIALASFIAYCVGQLLDIFVFNKLRNKSKWWIAPSLSTLIGNAIDAGLFFFVAFYKSSDKFMANNWTEIASLDYATRMTICFLFFLPIYGVILNYIIRYLKSKQSL